MHFNIEIEITFEIFEKKTFVKKTYLMGLYFASPTKHSKIDGDFQINLYKYNPIMLIGE